MSSPRYPNFSFTVTHRDANSRSRTGRLTTPHGTIDTPYFVFCGTKAAIKGLLPAQMRAANTQIVLANTYHLLIQPGEQLVAAAGGLHRFTGWDGPMLTDSGGYQVFAMQHGSVVEDIKGKRVRGMPSLLAVAEEGATFRSYLDGRSILLTPERAMQVQRALGADLLMPLDECTAYRDSRDYTTRSMERSHRWEDRSLAEFDRSNDGTQALYGIVQGGIFPDLRQASTEYTASRDFFGTAVGGCLGATKQDLLDVVAMSSPYLHPERPVHLLGVGGIDDILDSVPLGMDSFDCVAPTRAARHGWALRRGVRGNRMNLRNARFRPDRRVLEAGCGCATCAAGVTRSYIHHLLRASEVLALILLMQHNVFVMNRLLAEIRLAIPAGSLPSVRQAWLDGPPASDPAV